MGMPPSPPAGERPYWLFALIALGLILFYQVWANAIYAEVLTTLKQGIAVTALVTVTAYVSACLLGLGLAVAGLSRWALLRQSVRFYIEVVRGVPIMVLLLYVAFVGAPALVSLVNWAQSPLGFDPWKTRDFPLIARAIIALTIAYSAFLAEIFRAGLLSVDKGQIEAAQALGLNGWQRFRLIVLPQAFRTILPPLGNDFVAMVKDSSLVSVLGVADVTQLGKVLAAGNFRYFETYNVVALVYLTITITLSLILRKWEERLRGNGLRG